MNKPLSFINYVLIHLTKNIICFNIEHLIRDLLFKNLKLKTTNYTNIELYIDYILNSITIKPGKTFINILYDEIPAKLVQNSVNIFKDYTEKTLFIPESIKEILSNLF